MVKNGWSLVYKKAIHDDGSLLFPERLSNDVLASKKRVLGSYIFANQYQNEIIPSDEMVFRPEWRKYYNHIPTNVYRFGFIDPAISENDSACFTGISVVAVDSEMNWYVQYAKRERINPSQIIDLSFELCERFSLKMLGIEDVAFQRVIVHFANEEMKRRNKRIPMFGYKRGNDRTKEQRILSLVPRFEWGNVLLAQGLHQLEEDLDDYPRGQYLDLLDSLASIEDIVHYPQKPRSSNAKPSPNDPEYEKWFIRQRLAAVANGNDETAEGG